MCKIIQYIGNNRKIAQEYYRSLLKNLNNQKRKNINTSMPEFCRPEQNYLNLDGTIMNKIIKKNV